MSRMLDLSRFVAEKLKWQEQVLHDGELTPVAKVIGCQLMHDLDVDKRGAWRSQIGLAEVLNIHLRTVRRCIAELVKRGHLITTPSRGRGNAILYEALLKSGSEVEERGHFTPSFPKGGKRNNPSVKEGALDAGKGALGAPPLLYDPITPKPPQTASAGESALLSEEARTAFAVPNMASDGPLEAVPTDIRNELSRRLGRSWVASYIDPSSFNLRTTTIHPRTGMARGRIHEEGRIHLRELGVELGEPLPPHMARRA